MLLSISCFAGIDHKVEIPMPDHHRLYYGTMENELDFLYNKLSDESIRLCGSQDKVSALSRVEVKLEISTLNLNDGHFVGSYPLSGLSAFVHCID